MVPRCVLPSALCVLCAAMRFVIVCCAVAARSLIVLRTGLRVVLRVVLPVSSPMARMALETLVARRYRATTRLSTLAYCNRSVGAIASECVVVVSLLVAMIGVDGGATCRAASTGGDDLERPTSSRRRTSFLMHLGKHLAPVSEGPAKRMTRFNSVDRMPTESSLRAGLPSVRAVCLDDVTAPAPAHRRIDVMFLARTCLFWRGSIVQQPRRQSSHSSVHHSLTASIGVRLSAHCWWAQGLSACCS